MMVTEAIITTTNQTQRKVNCLLLSSCSVISDALQPNGLQHARLPCSLLPGASVRNSAHGKGHEEGGFSIHKGGIEPQETPCSRASTPKTRVCLLYLCSHLHLWLYGGLSPITISLREGVNMQLQFIKIPGRDKSVSTYKLLWSFSSLPERVRPAACDCLQPPNHERHEML